MIATDIRRQVILLAAGRCKYYRMDQSLQGATFHVEHIIAKQHVDDDVDDPNALALACNRCNAYKGTNLSSIDPETKDTVLLYNPRQDRWQDHFMLRDGEIVGLTAAGRATVRLLHMNAPQRLELRLQWLEDGGEL